MDQETPPHKGDIPPMPEELQAEFFGTVLGGALEAERRVGAITRDLDLAGTRLRLIFAGPALDTVVMPALAHLEIAQSHSNPDATIHVWDSGSTGVPAPPRPCPVEWLTDRGDIWGMSSPRYRSSFHWVEAAINVLDLQQGLGVYWTNDAATLPYWAKASPFRPLFHWWLGKNGCQLLHAAAVGTEDGALLITGKGGVGKSSTALACLSAGMRYVGDDYLAVRLDPEPTVYSLYSTAKLDADQASSFPALQSLVANQPIAPEEKAVLQLFPEFARSILRSCPLRAIATPTFGEGPVTEFVPVSAMKLTRSAMFTTMSQLPHAGQSMQELIHRMAHSLPRAEIRLGSNREGIPPAIRAFLGSGSRLRAMTEATPPDATRPLVSVVIPVHNGATFLEDAVRSVLGQEYPSLQIIVVDDGSTDEIDAVIKRLPVDVQFFRQPRGGPASAKNRGIRDAAGEFIGFLDADDLWPAGNLDSLVAHLEQDQALDVVLGRTQPTRYSPTDRPGEYLGDARDVFPYCVASALYRRGVFQSVGLFDPGTHFWGGSRLVHPGAGGLGDPHSATRRDHPLRQAPRSQHDTGQVSPRAERASGLQEGDRPATGRIYVSRASLLRRHHTTPATMRRLSTPMISPPRPIHFSTTRQLAPAK